MAQRYKKQLVRVSIVTIAILLSVLLGITFGLLVATFKNSAQRVTKEQRPAVPTRVFDRNGQLITEFFSEEKRAVVPIDELPKHFIDALLTREDRFFYSHKGFRISSIASAAWDIITGRTFRGGSTITQQLAGYLYTDRTEITVKRKLVELWWAVQLERKLSKQEILESYANLMYFGHNTYGVEAASEFYFGHPARELTIAESAMLVIQLANPSRYSPINHPNRARTLQREILDQMVDLDYTTQELADKSFQSYWETYDYTRSSRTSAWYEREDQAPYFSEYVRQLLEDELMDSFDIYREGLQVYTTLDFELQKIADQVMGKWIRAIDVQQREQEKVRNLHAEETFTPVADLLSLSFNIEELSTARIRNQQKAKIEFLQSVAPSVEILSSLFGFTKLKEVSRIAQEHVARIVANERVQGALIAIDSSTGYILAMVGGRKYEITDQFNRAVQGRLQPGSAFKPLYYSAAISSRAYTPATMLVDAPIVFWNDDGTPYVPLNYKGIWSGPVLLRQALAKSMNVPSLKILDGIGFDAAIERSSRLLGISEPQDVENRFPRKYPLGLGVVSVSPLQMVRAYATFANQGKAVDALAIRYVEDRNGHLISEPEKRLRLQQAKSGDRLQIMSAQDAFIMVNLLRSTVEEGTLRYANRSVGGFDRPVAGKTGTTQNWTDAWTVGFSPQIAAAVWFGFDRSGHSLGVNVTGATAAGPAWAEFMKIAHEGLPIKEFAKPAAGLVEVTVSARSGLLPRNGTDTDTIREIFITGTEPKRFDDDWLYQKQRNDLLKANIRRALSSGVEDSAEILAPYLNKRRGVSNESSPGLDPDDLRNPLLD
jgi:penicillin-binding protein 1A